jgi:hypothetical protein
MRRTPLYTETVGCAERERNFQNNVIPFLLDGGPRRS